MTDYFYDIPGNPKPERATSGYITAFDQKKLRYALFPATSRPLKGTVIILPGRNECIEKYFETARDLAARGLGSASLDWRGQGASDRLIRDAGRGHVRGFLDYTRDLEQFFAEIVLPDCRGPYYILAHSMGALIALLGTPAMVNRVRRMVLIAPFFALHKSPLSMPAIRRMGNALYYSGLGKLYVSGGRQGQVEPFATNKLTTDPARYRRNCLLYETYPHLGLGGPTVAWIRAAAEASAIVQSPEFMAKVQIPTLFIVAGADEVVSNRAIEDYSRRLRVGSLLTIDGARHEILQEADIYREQFLAAFDAFIPGSDAPVI
ncbi:alpha/beta hydrolase [Mesorhizobium sp. YR577]|uniref:alpha/beta fold hydrolase n=1 Tax=Mesorhizobium sp. YR577 TaxID=1884373 RepID=UPI0008EE4405|nr:alpha/beta hydrolase [Mesorhizobium sp. YR577]SFU06640.1 lysophospholipase [Mesorhizobium sp. YR577]